jgi:hypothetical protein
MSKESKVVAQHTPGRRIFDSVRWMPGHLVPGRLDSSEHYDWMLFRRTPACSEVIRLTDATIALATGEGAAMKEQKT